MLTFLRTRLYIITALVLTLLAFYALISRQSFDAEWMLKWNHVDSGQVQWVYGVLIVVMLLALPFAPRIQAALQRGRVVVFILATVACFLSISLLEPNQEHRLFVSPFSIWVIIAHIVTIAGLVVWCVTEPLRADEFARFKVWFAHRDRLLVGLYVVVIVVLIVLHVASVGEFMNLDTPDEPWLASMATNYAENNDLSPSFIGSSYGSPDPVLPRYYLLMGFWLRPAGSSLVALRMMPIFILMLVVIIMAVMFWRNPSFTLIQALGGIIILLSVDALVRVSHNLRADVVLAVYGALILWALIQMFGNNTHHRRWAAMGGLALYIGLESIPFVTLILALVVGVMLIIWFVRQQHLRSEWQVVAIYAVCCALALGLYIAMRFLPDIQTSLKGYQLFNKVYTGQTKLGALRFPLDMLINYHMRFSLVLSPVELVLIFGALVLLWRWGTSIQRWVLITFAIALAIMLTVSGFAFSYWTLFVPLAAYAAAYALRSRRVLVISSFVLLPALVAVPFNDMLTAIQTRPNQTFLESVEPLSAHIPSGTTLIGENNLWFALHTRRKFIGVDGFWLNMGGHSDRSVAENIQALGVNALLCSEGNSACEAIISTGLFQPPETYVFGNSTYLLYWRLAT